MSCFIPNLCNHAFNLEFGQYERLHISYIPYLNEKLITVLSTEVSNSILKEGQKKKNEYVLINNSTFF